MKIRFHLKQVRRFSQALFLIVFLVLFRLTDYNGSDIIPYAVNIFFRLDPLVLASVTLAEKKIIALLWPSLIVIVGTLLMGRVFCSWVCPMGTAIDMAGRAVAKKDRRIRLSYLKYLILIVVLLSAAFGVQLLAFFDPFSLLVRGLVFSIDPGFKFIVSSAFDAVYNHGPQWLSAISEPVYSVLKSFVLPYKQSFFYLSLFSFVLLAAVFALEFFGRRFWCRNLCPLGALLALISRFSLFRRRPVKLCSHCGQCATDCRMDVFDHRNRFRFEECNLCMDCLEFCPDAITTFQFASPAKYPKSLDLTRRQFLTAAVSGVALPVAMKTDAISGHNPEGLIRPPGAKADPDFSGLCVRCGECMKVCINNALQPLWLERGIEGMFTPVLVPRLGYCEFNCTLCSQVCPTGAIQKLTQKEKHAFVIGKAVFDKDKCLVYAQKKGCIVCEEHCPTHDKAIKFTGIQTIDLNGDMVYLKQPFVDEKLCIGCGICEHICPVEGKAAIFVEGKTNTIRKEMY